MIASICRLCLDPENDSEEGLSFARNLCYCKEGNLHRKCLEEWVAKSGYKNCNRCHCQYNVTFVARSLPAYIWSSPDEWVKLVQKALRFINILHITLITFYFLLFVPIDSWVPFKFILMAFFFIRTYINMKSISIFAASLLQNYRSWKERFFSVIINGAY